MRFRTDLRFGNLLQKGRILVLRSDSNMLGCVGFRIMAFQNWRFHSDEIRVRPYIRVYSDMLHIARHRSLSFFSNLPDIVIFPKNTHSHDGLKETFYGETGYLEAFPPGGHAEVQEYYRYSHSDGP